MKKFSFLIILLLLIVGGITVWWINSTMSVNPADTKQRIFTVEKGKNVKEIAADLKQDGLIKDTVAFYILVKADKLDNKMQAGQFSLAPSMDTQAIITALQSGTQEVKITIPEGKRAEEIADILQEHLTSYEPSWRDKLIAQEGYLFPDTYLLPKDATIDQVIAIMTDTFNKKYATVAGPRKNSLTTKELVTVASMVEREARHAEDRPLVASVILNRYDIGMALDIDATVQYAVGYDQQSQRWWKPNLSIDDLAINSPYNTYKVVGLPPTPIANPGLEALKAAANPAQTDYLFYLTDSNGINHYAKTNEEHEANKRKYGL